MSPKKILKSCVVVVCCILLAGCASYSFGYIQYFPSDRDPKLGLFVWFTPREAINGESKREAILTIHLTERESKRRLVEYRRDIFAYNLDYETNYDGNRLKVAAWDRIDRNSRWEVVFVRQQNGHFRLDRESGEFLK